MTYWKRALLCAASITWMQASESAIDSAAETARALAEAPRIVEVALSPDAVWVAYAVVRGSVASNNYTSELWLERTARAANASSHRSCLARVIDERPAAFKPRWLGNSESISYFAPAPGAEQGTLVEYSLGSRETVTVPIRAFLGSGPDKGTGAEPHGLAIGADYQWASNQRTLAFTAPVSGDRALDPRRGIPVSLHWLESGAKRSGLFVLDVGTGVARRVSTDQLHVLRFSWAPNGKSLVIAATGDAEGVPTFHSDLFTIDLTTGATRPLVVQPGMDGNPSWSPDGQWIAFTSHFGTPSYFAGWPAVVSTQGGRVIRLADDSGPKLLSTGAPAVWAADSSRFYFGTLHQMTHALAYADLKSKRATIVSGEDQSYWDNLSFSKDATRVSFTRETPEHPTDLFSAGVSSALDAASQLTRFADNYPLGRLVRTDVLSWPSRDGKFTIHGILLTPRSAWSSDKRIASPLATLTFLNGGPGMVRSGFAQDGINGSMFMMAVRGYAVLAPNTRGRGGFGEAFQRGIRDGASVGRLPYEDAMAGLDVLVGTGIADPKRLGVFGHSYGGYLTAYTITQTDRFRAAVVHEGGSTQWLTAGMLATPGTDWALLARDLHGIHDPYDAAERDRLIAESPGLNVMSVKTPTLLSYGAKSGLAFTHGRAFFHALSRFRVPSQLVVYDESHVFQRPAAVADNLVRTALWFDYFILGKGENPISAMKAPNRPQ